MPSRTLLITGITGFVGGALAARWGTGTDSVLAVVRAPSVEFARARIADSLARFVGRERGHLFASSVGVLLGDLASEGTFDEPAFDAVTHVVHSAACTSFASTREAQRSNVWATRLLVERMRRGPRLARFLHVSSAYCCGDRPSSVVHEDHSPRPDHRYVNDYSRTKADAERFLLAIPEFPLIIARPSVVIGHSTLGVGPSASLFWYYRTLAALRTGPFSLSARRDIVPVDYVADALDFLLRADRLRFGAYHVSAGAAGAVTVGQIVALFGASGPWRTVSPGELAEMHDAISRLGVAPAEARKLAFGLAACARFGALGIEFFDNERLLSEGFRAAPRFTDYLPTCMASTRARTPYEQMVDDAPQARPTTPRPRNVSSGTRASYEPAALGLSCGRPLRRSDFEDLCRRAVLDCFKWNVDDGRHAGLCRFPLIIERQLFSQLSTWAVALDAEARQAEAELLSNVDLRARLGLPWRLRLALRRASQQDGCRYSRFDFHPTVEGGFAITEGNLDVAAGFNESSGVTKLFADCTVGAESGGDPATALATAIRATLPPGGTVGCMYMTNFVEDHQVARFLAQHLEQAGLVPVLFGPSQLGWTGPYAHACVGSRRLRLDAILRLFPAEWLPRLAASSRWWRVFEGGATSWVNPTTSLLTQSKRFPLTWSHLTTPLPTWRHLLPETRSPREVGEGEWVLKPAFAHDGYRVAIAGVTERSAHASITRSAKLFPWKWVAQRRFSAAPLATPDGPRFPSIGVYVVNGRPAGLYGRLAERPLINDTSQDVVILVRREV